MEDKKRGLDDLLSDLGIGDTTPSAGSGEPVVIAVPDVNLNLEQTSPTKAVEDFFAGMFERLGVPCSIRSHVQDHIIHAEILGGDSARMIGKEGKTLLSLEYLCNVYVAKFFGNQYRVVLDASGYRKRNELRLHKLTMDVVLQVELSGQAVAMEPMRSSERRLVHMWLKEHQVVGTYSAGEGGERHIIVCPREQLPQTPDNG